MSGETLAQITFMYMEYSSRLEGYTNPTPHFFQMQKLTVRFLRWYKFFCWEIPKKLGFEKTEFTALPLWTPLESDHRTTKRLCNSEFNGFLPRWMVGIRLFDDCFPLGLFPIFQGRFVFWLVLVGSVGAICLDFFFGWLFFEGVQRNG